MREIKFPNPVDGGNPVLTEPNTGVMPSGKDLFFLQKLKHRYFVVTGPAEHARPVCERLEDEGFDVLSVSAFLMPHGGQTLQVSQITARIVRSALPTQMEQEVEEASKRLIQPAHGNLPPNKR